MNGINIIQNTNLQAGRTKISLNERRKYPRYPVDLPIDYSRVGGREVFGGIVKNISEGGVLAYFSNRMEIGAVLRIEIICIQGFELYTINAISKVVWTELERNGNTGYYRYGLQFLYIEEKDFHRLQNLLKTLKK